jgi:uncharacterized protein (TIRG00374 family)
MVLGPKHINVTFRKRKWILVMGIFIGVSFLWLALRDTSLEQVGGALLKANFWLVPPFLVVLGLFYWMKAWRWSLLLNPVRKTETLEAFPAVTIGFTGNVVLPAQLGELVRVYVISRQLGIRGTPVLATVFLERVFDFLTIFVFLVVGLLVSRTISRDLVDAGYLLGSIGLGLIVVVLLFIIWTERFMDFFRQVTIFLPDNLRSKLTAQIEFGAHGMQSIRSPRLLAGATLISIAQWSCMALCVYAAIRALRIDVPLSASAIVLVLIIAVSTLPNSPGQVGLIQIAFTTALNPYGVSAGDAFAASVFFHVFGLSIIIVAVYYIRQMGYTLTGILREAESDEEKAKVQQREP